MFGHELLHVGRKLQQPEGVGDGGAILARTVGDLVVAQVEIPGEALEGMRDLDGVEVLALDVFDQG